MFKKPTPDKKIASPAYISSEALHHTISLLLLKVQGKIPNFQKVQSAVGKKLTSEFKKTIENYVLKLEQLPQLLKKLRAGDFDKIIFSANPKATQELMIILELDNRSFIECLFFKCDSKKTLQFWMSNGAELTKDAVGLAINLNSNIQVFEYLNEKGFLPNDLNERDKENVLRKIKCMEQETCEYIANALGVTLNDTLTSNI